MKKEIKIGLMLLSIFGAVSMTAHSFSLVIVGANDATFGISQLEKTYYLKGSFNSWEASNEYKLEDVTETMSPEEGKIKEYTITKALEKDQTLKMWDNTNRWYTQGEDNCSYADKWSRSTEISADYVVPMTATYTFYLKLYESGASQVYVTAPDLTRLYFKPSTDWASANARFAAYFFEDEDNYEWADLQVDGDYYSIAMPADYTKVIFCRMNPDTLENNWSNKWNQTGDLDFSPAGYKNLFEVPTYEGEYDWNVGTNANWRAR